MPGIVTRKPVVGFATALIFSFLGLLLIDRSTSPGRPNGIVLWMFRVLGWFLLFAALGSVVVAVAGIVSKRKEK